VEYPNPKTECLQDKDFAVRENKNIYSHEMGGFGSATSLGSLVIRHAKDSEGEELDDCRESLISRYCMRPFCMNAQDMIHVTFSYRLNVFMPSIIFI